MVHAYCAIRDSWTGWLRGRAMSRTLHEEIVPEMRDLQSAERRIADKPSITLLAVLDYAGRARRAVPRYTPLGIDHPQPRLPDEVREACARMEADADAAALASRRAGARAYAARMADAIEREREEEARRRRAMAEHGVTETPEEAAAATARVEARIALYARERERALTEAGLDPDGRPLEKSAAPRATPVPDAAAREGARTQAILAAMRAWTGPRLKHGRHRGAPYLRALRRETGLGDIARTERNRLWRLVAPEGARRQGAPEGARRQGAPEGARRQGAPEGARRQGAPEGARRQGAPEGARRQGAPEGARRQGAPEGARRQGAPEGARRQGAPEGAPESVSPGPGA